eukprot:m.651939 g.651939  ORF g.651939 m.651939 type:complete len:803 (+) comp22684_c0_seq2:98-2506(+)
MGNSLSGSVLDDLGKPGGMNERLVDDEDSTAIEKVDRNAQKWPNEYESLDYDPNENESFRRKYFHASSGKVKKNDHDAKVLNRNQWIMHAAIGICVGLTAFFIDYFIRMISGAKFKTLEHMVMNCQHNETMGEVLKHGCLAKPYFTLVTFNVGFVLIATSLCGAFALEAKGSGIPEIKCFLNGIKRRGWLNLKTMIVKVLGVLFSVSATMPVGKEGPMIHSGAIVGAGLPQLKSTQFGFDFRFLAFRTDHAKRDFVAAGAAAGVSAAFGAPIGGVLFSLEEGASFWTQTLTWKTTLTSIMALFTLRFFLAGTAPSNSPDATSGWGRISAVSLVDFGTFTYANKPLWDIVDVFIFIAMGILGGLLGALWCYLQKSLTQWRMRMKFTVRQQMMEACFFCFVNTTVFFLASMSLGKCEQLVAKVNGTVITNTSFFTNGNWVPDRTTRQFFCNDETQYNDMATLSFNPLEDVIKHLFHFDGFFSFRALITSFILLFITSCWTYGLLIPSGLFVPMLVTGAVYGRIVGEFINQYTEHSTYPGTYALIGAAAFLGGVARMTISLTVILLEATSEIIFAPPIVLTLLVAKWVGDRFDFGIYDIHIFLKKIPLLEWEAEEEMKRFQNADVMTKDLVTTYPVARVSDVVSMLTSCTHNGFPVVVEHTETPGTPQFLGLVLRSDLITLLQNRIWGELRNDTTDQPFLSQEAFDRKYPNRTPLSEVILPPPDSIENLWMDITPYMNNCPYTMPPHAPLTRTFRLFRTLGLRHVCILDEDGGVIGIVTRKELTGFRMHELMHEFDHANDHSSQA